MATLDTGLLSLILFLAIGSCLLFFVGIYNIRRGLQNRSTTQVQTEPQRWYRLPKVLLGLNNITFALLLVSIIFINLFTTPLVHLLLFVLICLLLIISIGLVIYTVIASLDQLRTLQRPPTSP